MSELWTECPNSGHTSLATIDCGLQNILSPKGSRKKVIFLVDSPVRPLAPPLPPGLVVKIKKKNIKKKVISFLVDNSLPPPSLSGLNFFSWLP